jgi:FkbM family methyltransferase
MQRDLIFDFGMHDGSDTAYYLRKGFRVVAVEANPELVTAGESRFRAEIAEGRLTIVNKAIAEQPGTVTLYLSDNTLWSSLDSERTEQFKQRMKVNAVAVEVEAITSDVVLAAHGVPYYLKIDIEGMDMTALRGLRTSGERPPFISMESARRDLQGVRDEIALLQELGYDRFKVVPQHHVQYQKEPSPPREGKPAGTPLAESSGLFARDLPGPWLSAAEAVDAYRRPLLNHYLTGSDHLIRNRWLRAGLKRAGFRPGWYDTHAMLAGVPAVENASR